MTATRQQAALQCAAVLDEKFFKAFSEPTRAAVFQQVVLLGDADIGAIAACLPQIARSSRATCKSLPMPAC